MKKLNLSVMVVGVVIALGTVHAAEILPDGSTDHIHGADVDNATKVNVLGENSQSDIDSDEFLDNEGNLDGSTYKDTWYAKESWYTDSWSDPFGDGDGPGDSSSFSLWDSWPNKTVSTPDWGGALAFDWSTPVALDEVRLYTRPTDSNLPTAWAFWLKDADDGTWTQFGGDVDNSSDGTGFEQFVETREYAQTVIELSERMDVSRMVFKAGNRGKGEARMAELETVEVIPEPSTLLLFGLAGLLLMKRRRL